MNFKIMSSNHKTASIVKMKNITFDSITGEGELIKVNTNWDMVWKMWTHQNLWQTSWKDLENQLSNQEWVFHPKILRNSLLLLHQTQGENIRVLMDNCQKSDLQGLRRVPQIHYWNWQSSSHLLSGLVVEAIMVRMECFKLKLTYSIFDNSTFSFKAQDLSKSRHRYLGGMDVQTHLSTPLLPKEGDVPTVLVPRKSKLLPLSTDHFSNLLQLQWQNLRTTSLQSRVKQAELKT